MFWHVCTRLSLNYRGPHRDQVLVEVDLFFFSEVLVDVQWKLIVLLGGECWEHWYQYHQNTLYVTRYPFVWEGLHWLILLANQFIIWPLWVRLYTQYLQQYNKMLVCVTGIKYKGTACICIVNRQIHSFRNTETPCCRMKTNRLWLSFYVCVPSWPHVSWGVTQCKVMGNNLLHINQRQL